MADYYSEAEINKRIKQLEQERRAADAAYLSQLGDINKVSIANQQKAAEEAILQTQQDYKDIYDANAVQEQITLRQIEESMANLGLSDSGLSRSQITAAILSKNNANAKYRRQEQAAINSIRQQLSDYKMKLEQGQAQTGAELSRNTADAIAQARQDEYAAGQKYQQDIAKAQNDATKAQEDRWYDLYLRHYDVENGVDSKQAASIAASLMGGYMPSGAKRLILGDSKELGQQVADLFTGGDKPSSGSPNDKQQPTQTTPQMPQGAQKAAEETGAIVWIGDVLRNNSAAQRNEFKRLDLLYEAWQSGDLTDYQYSFLIEYSELSDIYDQWFQQKKMDEAKQKRIDKLNKR